MREHNLGLKIVEKKEQTLDFLPSSVGVLVLVSFIKIRCGQQQLSSNEGLARDEGDGGD